MADDLLTAILEDHAEIRGLFERVDMAAGPEARQRAFEDLVRKLAVHETAEEEVVHLLAREGDGGDAVVEERLREEDASKKLLSAMEKLDVTSDEFQQRFAELRRAVLAHAEKEEQLEHPLIRQTVSTDRLQKLATAFEVAEKAAPTHPHPHGPESAVGNLLVGPVVMLMDKTRDAVRDAVRKLAS